MGVSSTSAKLMWSPPEKHLRNGRIMLYEIQYYERNKPIETTTVNTTDTQQVIEGLEMNTDYIFKIKAFTEVGAGPWSQRLPFRTFGQRESQGKGWG